MRIIKSRCFIFFLFIHLPSTFCQRRIIGGQTPNVNATFVVYLLRAEAGAVDYKGWTCGGAIVNRNFVLTSAACLEEGQHLYVIAGYDKYMSADRMEGDACIINTRRKVISWCYHQDYNLGPIVDIHDHIWSVIDIALARVDPTFDFTDPKYLQYCSYQPSIISVGVAHGRSAGTSALVYGWGHRRFYNSRDDDTDYNSERLRYASVRIIPITECSKRYPYNSMITNMLKYNICTDGPGFLDDEGHITNVVNVPYIHCKDDSCSAQSYHETRPQGFCQNDHGGPLVMWVGSEQFVVGVATSFMMAGDRRCIPPFRYTSTSCVNKFLMCVLSRTRRTDHCAQEHDMVIVDKHLNWTQVTEATTTETVKRNQKQAAPKTKRTSTEELYWLYD